MRNRPAVTALIVTAGLLVPVLLPDVSAAQTPDVSAAGTEFRPGQFVIWPSGSLAFPTGRFAEEDLDSSSLKIGLKTLGYDAALDLGYVLSEDAIIGLAFGYSRYSFDLTPEILSIYRERGIEVDAGHSATIQAHAWLRYLLPEPFPYWRPYVVLGAGVGRPKGTVEYAGPTHLGELSVVDQERTVNLSAFMTGGVGSLIPVSPQLAFCCEARYNRISSKGTARTDAFTLEDGSTVEVKYGEEGGEQFRLKAKSNTEWWEVRAGILFFLK